MKKTISPKLELVKASKMRVSIDSDWAADDFSIFFGSFDSLYTFYEHYGEGLSLIGKRKKSKTVYDKEEHTPWYHFRISSVLIKSFFNEEGIYRPEKSHSKHFSTVGIQSGLKVMAVEYSSPGFTDFVGLSGVIGHLKEVLKYYFPNKLSKEEAKIKEQERIALQIKNLKLMGFSSIEIKKIILLEEVNLGKIKSLIESGRITSIEVTEN
jgi:hypothetical protein